MQTVPTQQAFMDAYKARHKAWGMLAKPEPVVIPDGPPLAVERKLRLPRKPPSPPCKTPERGDWLPAGDEIVARFVGGSVYSERELRGRGRALDLMAARNHLLWLLHKGTPMSNGTIGEHFGGRTKGAVWRGVEQHEKQT